MDHHARQWGDDPLPPQSPGRAILRPSRRRRDHTSGRPASCRRLRPRLPRARPHPRTATGLAGPRRHRRADGRRPRHPDHDPPARPRPDDGPDRGRETRAARKRMRPDRRLLAVHRPGKGPRNDRTGNQTGRPRPHGGRAARPMEDRAANAQGTNGSKANHPSRSSRPANRTASSRPTNTCSTCSGRTTTRPHDMPHPATTPAGNRCGAPGRSPSAPRCPPHGAHHRRWFAAARLFSFVPVG